MPKPKSVPSYCLHKPSGRARVSIDGKQVYLGVFGSPESCEAYARFITQRFLPGHKGASGENVSTVGMSSSGIDARTVLLLAGRSRRMARGAARAEKGKEKDAFVSF